MDVVGDHFSEETMEDASLEWDCYADESYDIICHTGNIDDLHWADISQTRPTATLDFPMGDAGQSDFIAQDLCEDHDSSSLQTMTWTPFQENLPMPGRDNSDEHLSASSSSTEYFSCFDSESDDENMVEKRHFDAEFKDLNLCLNIAVSHGNKDPTISITTKAEKKQIPVSSGEMVGDIEPSESSSSVDLLDIQSMVNEQNDKSFLRYRLLDMHDLDIEFLLDEDGPTKEREDFVPSWCQIFKPLGEETDNAVASHSVKNLVEAYENKFRAQEEKCQVSTLRNENKVSNKVNVSTDTQLNFTVEKNLEANRKHTVSAWTTNFVEDFTDEGFQVFRKISESIIRESFEELELESRSELRMVDSEQVLLFNTGENPPADRTVTIKKSLNIEEERINNSNIIYCEAIPVENQTTLAIQTQLISEGCEQMRNIAYNQEQFVLPSDVIVKKKETYQEQCVDQIVEQTNQQPVCSIPSIVSESESSDKDQELEWSHQGQIVPTASISTQPLRDGKITCSIVLPEISTFGATENIQNISEDAVAKLLAAFMQDNDPCQSIIYKPELVKERNILQGQDKKSQNLSHTWQVKEMISDVPEQITLPPSISLNTKELGFEIDSEQEDKCSAGKLQWSEHGQLVPMKETLPLQEDNFSDENLQWNQQGQLEPVNEALSHSKLQQTNHQLVSSEERNDEQKNLVKHRADLVRNKQDKVKSIIASFEKSMRAAQNGNGFHSLNQTKNEEAIVHTKEVKSGLVTEYSQKCYAKLTKENPQPPQAKHENIKNISKLLHKIEKICNGKSVHVQQEHTTQERWYGNLPCSLYAFPQSTLMANTTFPVLPVTSFSAHVPKITVACGTNGGDNATSDRTELKKEFKSYLESHPSELPDGGCKQCALKLKYQSKEATINLEYSQEKTSKEILPHTAQQNQENKHSVAESHKPPTISKYYKIEIGDGKTVYSDVKNWSKETRVQKMCEVFEGADPKVPQITYRISKEDPIQTPETQQQLGGFQRESPQYATSRSDGKSKKRFDLERYIRKRGENMITRKSENQNASDEAYYHVAKMLTIRVIANAKLQLSREYCEKDYAKRTTQKESHEAQSQNALPTSTRHVVNKSHGRYSKSEEKGDPLKNPHVQQENQSNKTRKKRKSSKKEISAHKKTQHSGSTKKDQSKDEKVLKSSLGSGCKPSEKKQEVGTHKGQQFQLSKKKHVKFDI